MPSPIRLTQSPLDLLAAAALNQVPVPAAPGITSDVPPADDRDRHAIEQSNLLDGPNCRTVSPVDPDIAFLFGNEKSQADDRDRHAIEQSNALDGPNCRTVSPAKCRTVSPVDPDIAFLFGNEKSQATKKRSRQRLSDDAKIDSAYAALEGMRAVKVLLEATIKPIETHSDPTVGLVIECLSLAVGKMESCTSALELACANTSSKKYANLAHRKPGGESRRRQKGEQLLMRGIGKTSAADALGHALTNAKATFARLLPEPSSELQQTLSTRRRVAAIEPSISPSEIHLPPPAEGHKIYSLHQAMSIVEAHSRDDSVSICAVLKEMIRRQLVPVKLTALYYNVKKHVGSDKPEAPMYWNGGILGGGQEIMPVGDLKTHFLAHQSEQIGRQRLKKDTAKVLFDEKSANAARTGIDASCIKQPDAKTVSTYHSTLMSMPEVTRQAGAYKPEHQDIGETSVRSMLSDLAGILYLSLMTDANFPLEHRFHESKAGEGLLLGRKALAKAFDVPVELVHYLPRGLMMNIDDMACIYSTNQGLSIINEEKGLVIKDDVNGPQ